MRGADHFYPGVQLAAWNVTEDVQLQIFSCEFLLAILILPVGQLWSATC